MGFKALGEPTRLKIVKLLSLQELCVCELVAVLDISQPRVSQHLKVLKKAGLIRERKERQRCFYSLDPVIGSGVIELFADYMKRNLEDIQELAAERERLAVLDDDAKVRQCKAGERTTIEIQPVAMPAGGRGDPT